MNNDRLNSKLINYSNALLRLKESLDADAASNPFVYDAAIQRFEFTYELAWKLLKAFLEYEGIAEVNTPRTAIKEAFSVDLIDNGDEPKAIQIYNKIKVNYYPQLAVLVKNISKAIEK
jgi:hypothetical protein